MLELKHLTKIYRTGNTQTRALDDVSLVFPDAGLVFLLGRSGSGKSTLLNLAGGLDSPTSGEIVFKGRSSKDFSSGDFDSYRNTFVGFVFQEYNVLDEFNVEDNVALAPELQGKKDRKRVREVLAEVGLEALAKRRPNTLSGGQKQRIAIARALVKHPEIIMADEPTGALDSTTGKQVLETLKSLSSTRLVLVVTHDREFAETYGDRIIELADGKVISDVTKTRDAPTVLTEGVIRHGDTLTVRGPLDERQLAAVNQFLREGTGEFVISRDNNDISAFKQAARIDEKGRECFAPTPALSPYRGERAKFIRSRLPAGRAFRIGASSLKRRPFRLILTVLLSIVAFVMFGLFSTLMLYDGDRVLSESLLTSEYKYLTVNKMYTTRVTGKRTYRGDHSSYTYDSYARFTPEELASFGGNSFGAYSVGSLSPSNVQVYAAVSDFYTPYICRVASIPEAHPLREGIKGSYPRLANEIAVSEYFAECLMNSLFGVQDENGNNTVKTFSSEDAILGECVLLNGISFEITGIFPESNMQEKYRVLKDDNENWILNAMYTMSVMEGLPSLALVSDAFVSDYSSLFVEQFTQTKDFFDYSENRLDFRYGAGEYDYYSVSNIKVYSGESVFPVLYFGEVAALAENEFIVPSYFLGAYYERQRVTSDEDILAYAAFQNAFSVWQNETVTLSEGDSFNLSRPATEEEISEAEMAISAYVQTHPIMGWTVTVGADSFPAAVLGIYKQQEGYSMGGIFCSQEFYARAGGYTGPVYETNYVPEEDAVYSEIFAPLPADESHLHALLGRMDGYDARDVGFMLTNILYENVLIVNSFADGLQTIFLWAGIVLALFASLLLFNFISVSISGKKKAIGILRAVGARGVDVFKIFFAESGIIVGICAVLSVIGTYFTVWGLNGALRAMEGLDVVLFTMGPLSVLIMFAVAAAVAVLSTLLPVWLAARKKPVESIRAL